MLISFQVGGSPSISEVGFGAVFWAYFFESHLDDGKRGDLHCIYDCPLVI